MKITNPFATFFYKTKRQVNPTPEYYDTLLGVETTPYIAIGGEEYALYASQRNHYTPYESTPLNNQTPKTTDHVDCI